MKGSFPSADRILMSWWTLLGRMARVDAYLFLNREHQQRSQRAMANRDFRAGSILSRYIGGGPTPPYPWWDAKYTGKIVFPEWRWVWEYLRAARCTRLPLRQKLGALMVMAGLYVKFSPRLARDVLIAAELLLYRMFKRPGAPAAAAVHSTPPHSPQSAPREAA
jgi:hypothetical protein